jgi:hypothetical protein
MDKDTALDLALEALKYAQYSDEFAIERGEKAITAIKQALAAPVQDTEAHYKGVVEGVQKLFDDKRAQPAQQQWVEVEQVKWDGEKFIAKLKEKNNG